MKKILFVCITICLIHSTLKSQIQQDSSAIKETTLNYIEGWYSGDTLRMEKSLHPELAKRGIVPSRSGSGNEILKASYSDMIKWTGQRPNLLKENKVSKSDFVVTIIEIGKNIANVKCVSVEYIDHLHLVRIHNEWKIINAVWEPNYNYNQKKKK